MSVRALDNNPDGIRSNTLYREDLEGSDHIEMVIDTSLPSRFDRAVTADRGLRDGRHRLPGIFRTDDDSHGSIPPHVSTPSGVASHRTGRSTS